MGVAQKSNAKELPSQQKQICTSILISPAFYPVTVANPLKVPRNCGKQVRILPLLKGTFALNGRQSGKMWGEVTK